MAKGYELPVRVVLAVKQETAGQTVLWTGQPDAWYALKWSSLIWLFAIPFAAMAVKMELTGLSRLLSDVDSAAVATSKANSPLVVTLAALPFLAIGLGMLWTPIWIAATACNTAHVVTANSILSVTAKPSGKLIVKTVKFVNIVSLERVERANGFGTLKIGLGGRRDSDGDLTEVSEYWYEIPDVRRVEGLVQARMTKST
jgi:hypothetical protein